MKRDRIDRRERSRLNDRVKYIQLNFRRVNFTLVGDAGRPWRRLIAGGVGAIALMLALVFGGAETQLMASPEIKQVQERGLLRVGVRYDYPGLNDGLEQGLAMKIAQRIMPDEEPGNLLELIEVSSVSATTKLDDGAVDMVIAMMSPEMDQMGKYNFSSSYYSDPCIMAVPSGTKSFPLRDVKLGCIQSNQLRTSAEDALLSAYMEMYPDLNLEKETFASYHDLLHALNTGRVDGAILPLSCFERYRAEYGIVRTSMTVGSANYAVMCASDTTVFAELASIVIDELSASGELARMRAEHGLE